MARRLLRLVVFFCGTFAAAASLAASFAADLKDFPWIDSDGRVLRLASLRGPLVVMTMGYTACRKVCGTTTLVLSDLQRKFDERGIDAQFVVVTYDPAKDSPAEWRDYRARREFTRANWHFLTGDETATRRVARSLDLDFWTYHDHIVHDFRVVLFDAQWKVLGDVDWDHVDRLESLVAQLPLAAAP